MKYGTKFTDEDKVSWTNYAWKSLPSWKVKEIEDIYSNLYTIGETREYISDLIEEEFPGIKFYEEYRGPGQVFHHKPSFKLSKTKLLIKQWGGYDI